MRRSCFNWPGGNHLAPWQQALQQELMPIAPAAQCGGRCGQEKESTARCYNAAVVAVLRSHMSRDPILP